MATLYLLLTEENSKSKGMENYYWSFEKAITFCDRLESRVRTQLRYYLIYLGALNDAGKRFTVGEGHIIICNTKFKFSNKRFVHTQ